MRVVAVRTKFENLPSSLASLAFSSESKIYISLGTEYEVYALSVFEGVAFLQIVNDVDIIAWLPAWLFEMRDTTLPHDWIGNLFSTEPSLVLGPLFVASDEEAYRCMVEQDLASCQKFQRRKDDLAGANREDPL
jgi:hypothetical protein